MPVIEKKPRRKGTTRYSVRVQGPAGKIDELAIDVNLPALIQLAKDHHDQHGLRVWVWNVRTGETLFEMSQLPKPPSRHRDSLPQKAGSR